MNDNSINEWLELSEHDLRSAEILIEQSTYFDIVVYHCHQSVEKRIKWLLLKNDIQFPFVHDIVRLWSLLEGVVETRPFISQISVLNSYLSKTRYPHGDKLQFEDAKRCIEIAKKISLEF